MADNLSDKPLGADGATAVVLDTHQQVLLHRRRDFHVWRLPGGRIEPNETGELAAIRETHEETGYDIAVQRFVGEYSRPQTSLGIQLVYVGYVVGGIPFQEGSETREVKWFSLNALPVTLSSTHRIAIRDAITNASTPIRRTLHISPIEAMMIRVLRKLRDVLQRTRD